MSCAACSARVEKAVSAVPGVTGCSVSLLTNTMGVEGDVPAQMIIDAVTAAGYGASVQESALRQKGRSAQDLAEEALKDHESPALKRRLIWSVILLLPLMYLTMGHIMWNWPIPASVSENHIGMGIYEMLLAGIIMIINQKFFISGAKSAFNGAPNMDTLVALGSFSSFSWSVFLLFAMTCAQLSGNGEAVKEYMHGFYFEAAAMIVTLITVGKMLEARSKGKTTNALKSLLSLTPKKATLLRNGSELTVDVSDVAKGDVFIVRPGESIPVDGEVIDGISAVNEAVLTGESIPVDKQLGSSVSAATINQSGFLTCRATRVGEDTTLSRIIQMVSDAAATKAPIAKIADKVSGIFVPAVIAIAFITTIVWLLAGESLGYALARGISVLVISCPCALGLATPVAIMVGSGMGAKNGILFKTAVSLEQAGKTSIIALDKTGTITNGEPKVTDILPADGIGKETLLRLALSLESKSEHPLARSIVDYCSTLDITPEEVGTFRALPGKGLEASLQGEILAGGNLTYIEQGAVIAESDKLNAESLAAGGKTPLFFRLGASYLGIIAVADTIKEDSHEAVLQLQNMGMRVVMLTGDNARTAQAIGSQAGVDDVVAGVLPEDKEHIIRQLKEYGHVAMVGDGINDAPALTRADIGIAIGAGTDVAIDAADIVLMKSRLSDVPAAIRLSRATLRNIHENLFWAFIYNIIGIPLAAGLFAKMLGWDMNPMFGAAAMSLSSFCVVSNALRLNFFDIHAPHKSRNPGKLADMPRLSIASPDYTTSSASSEQGKSQTITVSIEGMMCGHCEAHVQKALESLDGVVSARASHTKKVAVLELSSPVQEDVIAAAVINAGYEYSGMIGS